MKRIACYILALALVFALWGCGAVSRVEAQVEDYVPEYEPAQEPETVFVELPEDWYGCWGITASNGAWQELVDTRWDCCAQMLGTGYEAELIIWDEDLDKENYLARLELELGYGDPLLLGGEMLDGELYPGDVELRIDTETGDLAARGIYLDEENGDFEFMIFLRPWGAGWDDSSLKPEHYEDWYLPMIFAGMDIPDRIDVEDVPDVELPQAEAEPEEELQAT